MKQMKWSRGNAGSAMVEAAIYFPITLAILFMIILLSVIRLGVFRMETEEKETDRALANCSENQIRYYAGDSSLRSSGSDFGMKELPGADTVRAFFADTVQSISFPGERRVDRKVEAVQQISSLLSTLPLTDKVKIALKKTSSYMANHTRFCRVAEMYRNSSEIENLLGYSFQTLMNRYPYTEE